MPGLESYAQVLLLDRIGQLEAALQQLAGLIVADQERPCWVEGHERSGLSKARERCAAFIQRIDYTDDRDPGGTEQLQGLLGSSEETLSAVAEVNQLKDRLHDFLMCLDSGVLEPPRGAATQRAWTSKLLTAIGRARFNRRQATRHLVVLDQRPIAASFFWGRVRKIVKITRAQAQAMLEKRLAESDDRDPALRYQYECLLNLPEHEPLAQVQQLKDYPRVNLVFPGDSGDLRHRRTVRKQVMALSPIFYPAEPLARTPEVVALPEQDQKRQRLRRVDLQVEVRPFLPAIRVHRYRTE